MKYREIRVEVLLVVDEKWDEDSPGYVDHVFEDRMGDGKVVGLDGVAAAKITGIKKLEYDGYDEYPLYDNGEVWNKWT